MSTRTLTVRSLPQETYEGLKKVAAARNRSMEAQARAILVESVERAARWSSAAVLADLSGPEELADLDTPYVRSPDRPRPLP
jgi:plasmid stability protein